MKPRIYKDVILFTANGYEKRYDSPVDQPLAVSVNKILEANVGKVVIFTQFSQVEEKKKSIHTTYI